MDESVRRKIIKLLRYEIKNHSKNINIEEKIINDVNDRYKNNIEYIKNLLTKDLTNEDKIKIDLILHINFILYQFITSIKKYDKKKYSLCEKNVITEVIYRMDEFENDLSEFDNDNDLLNYTLTDIIDDINRMFTIRKQSIINYQDFNSSPQFLYKLTNKQLKSIIFNTEEDFKGFKNTYRLLFSPL